MVQTALSSTPCASAELAQAALNALLDQAGRDGEIVVLSMMVNEVDGLWIASAVVRIDEPERAAQSDEDVQNENERIRQQAAESRSQDFAVPYYILPHEASVADRSFPVDLEDANVPDEGPPMPVIAEDNAITEEDQRSRANDEGFQPLKGELEPVSKEADALAETMLKDFNADDSVAAASGGTFGSGMEMVAAAPEKNVQDHPPPKENLRNAKARDEDGDEIPFPESNVPPGAAPPLPPA